jgi:F-type H+-transporting ATPase subunit epsilon
MAKGKLHLQVVTAERMTFDGQVDIVTVPGSDGELGILPMHAPLLANLTDGALVARNGDDEVVMAIGGGFIEVLNDNVIVLADAAERADEIDLARAEAARAQAAARLQEAHTRAESVQAARELERSLLRLKVARTRRRSSGGTSSQ